MIDLKLAAIGSNSLIAEELLNSIHWITKDQIQINAYTVSEVLQVKEADIYICASTQIELLRKLLPDKKIILLELIPTSRFFISVARIPQGETIYIFNNQLYYPTILAKYCEDLGISGVKFLPIAFDEMPEQEVFKCLQTAKYIIGVDKFVGRSVLQSARYKKYLRPDVHIIPAARVASVQSSCALLRCIASILHKNIAERTRKIKEESIKSPESTDKLNAEVINLLNYSNVSINIIQDAVVNSVVNQISPDDTIINKTIALSPPAQDTLYPVHEEYPITQSLAAIMDINQTLSIITHKLSKIN